MEIMVFIVRGMLIIGIPSSDCTNLSVETTLIVIGYTTIFLPIFGVKHTFYIMII